MFENFKSLIVILIIFALGFVASFFCISRDNGPTTYELDNRIVEQLEDERRIIDDSINELSGAKEVLGELGDGITRIEGIGEGISREVGIYGDTIKSLERIQARDRELILLIQTGIRQRIGESDYEFENTEESK